MKDQKRAISNEKYDNSSKTVIIIAFALSLLIGFLDITIGLLLGRSDFLFFSVLLPPLAITTVSLFIIYISLWFLLLSHIRKIFELETIPFALSLAYFLGTIFTLASMSNLVHVSHIEIPTDLLKLFILLFVSILVSIGAYFTIKAGNNSSNYSNAAVVFSFTTPFVLAETMGFVWLHIYWAESFLSMQSFLLDTFYILIVILTFALFYSIGKIRLITILLIIFMVVIVLSPFVTLISARISDYPSIRYKAKNNKIRHVILITVDTLRADVLSCYKNQNCLTPHIDKLADDSILFSKAISSAPWTLPSIASIMTGVSPSVHMAIFLNSKLPDNLPTLAEYMRDAGYFTAAIGANMIKPRSNISRGFLDYNIFPPSPGYTFGERLLNRLFFIKQFLNQFLLSPSTDDITNLACAWLKLNDNKDFFLWLHYFDPHSPYSPPAKYLPKREAPPSIGTSSPKVLKVRSGFLVLSLAERKWIKDLYCGEVRYVDDNIGRLIDTLKHLNLYNESLIILTSDHGDEFWEHGGFDHGHTLYNELIHVPLIIKLPMSVSHRQIDKVVSIQRIMPTIVDLCGIDYDINYLPVRTLSPLWGPNSDAIKDEPIISTAVLLYEDRESVIFDGMKYIRSFETNHEELYDLSRDYEERFSIAISSPDEVQKAKDILKDNHKTNENLLRHFNLNKNQLIQLHNNTIEVLKSLGYVFGE